jgi:hypothetical protein
VVESKHFTNPKIVKPDFDASFDNEAKLLESCWMRVRDFKPKPDEAQAASLTATLFIQLHRWNA